MPDLDRPPAPQNDAKPASAAQSAPAVRRPRDAASLVVVDRSSSAPRVLMGRRRPDQVFLPDTFVFPGGRVEAADRALARRHSLVAAGNECLKIDVIGKPSDTRAAALLLAAIRETFEETGAVIGEAHDGSRADPPGGWQSFYAEGFQPKLDKLKFFARAITPPGRPRRYDTRFFFVEASEISHRAARVDGELLDIDWYTLDEARALKLPSITRYVLDDVAALLNRPPQEPLRSDIPFYVQRRGEFERRLLPRA